MDEPFALRYMETVGSALSLHERAKAGKLPDFVTDETLARLIAEGIAPPELLSGEIRHACYVGQIKARTIPGEPGVPLTFGSFRGTGTTIEGRTETVYIIHRDDARRYFAALDMLPPKGSALHCWLYGKADDAVRAKTQTQKEKEDFQQLCLEHWERSPTTGISTPGGVVKLYGGAYHCDKRTLHRWAAEVAPEHVKEPGRKKKETTA